MDKMDEEYSIGMLDDGAGFDALPPEILAKIKKTEDCENVPESPAIPAEEKDESDLQVKEESPVMPVEERCESDLQEKEKSQVLTREHQQKAKKAKPQYIRTTLDEDVFLRFKVMCATMNIPMGIVNSRLIENFVKKNENRVKMVVNENPEV